MLLLSFDQVHVASEWVLTILIPGALWWFNRTRKAEATRIAKIAEDVADERSAIIKKALDDHAGEDKQHFAEEASGRKELLNKLDDANNQRLLQHLENSTKLAKLEANSDAIKEWFADWRQRVMNATVPPRKRSKKART